MEMRFLEKKESTKAGYFKNRKKNKGKTNMNTESYRSFIEKESWERNFM